MTDARSSLADFSGQMGGVLDGLSSNTSSAMADLSADAGSMDGVVQGASGRIDGLLSEGTSINDSLGSVLSELNAAGVATFPPRAAP